LRGSRVPPAGEWGRSCVVARLVSPVAGTLRVLTTVLAAVRLPLMLEGYEFFDPDQPVEEYYGCLPHWRQEGVLYFVTFRTADSLPADKLRFWTLERADWLRRNPPPHTREQRAEYFRLFPARMNRWLDQGCGECALARKELKRIVQDSLRFFDGCRYRLDEHTVAPNHGHVLVQPLGSWELSDITGSWKKYTARRINRIIGKQGSFWEEESFDHVVRSPESLEAIRRYIRDHSRYLQCSRDDT